MNVLSLIRKKYDIIPIPAKASLWFAVCNFMQKGISMITMPIFTRLLSTEQYGIYTIYQSWYSVIGIFATLTLSAGVFYNGMIKFENDKDGFTSAMQGLSTVSTIVLFIVYLMGKKIFDDFFELSFTLIIVMFVEFCFVSAYSLWCARQRFEYQYKKMIITTLIIAIMSPVLGIITVILSEYKANARILSYAFVQICIGIVLYIFNIYKGRKFYVKEYWIFALCFNIPLIPHYLSMTILGQADRIMIGKMVGSSEAAIYAVAYNISQMMLLVTNAISNSFNPYTYKALKEKQYDKIKTNANTLLLIVAFGVILIACFGPEIVRIFAPTEYYDARWIIPPVALAVYFVFLYPLFSNIEFYFEANKFVMFASVIGAFLNILLNYLLIPICGYMIAGYTTLLCYIFFVVGHYVFHKIVLKKNLNIKKVYDIKFIFLCSVSLIIIVTIIVSVYDIIYLRYSIILLMIIALILKRNIFINSIKGIRN